MVLAGALLWRSKLTPRPDHGLSGRAQSLSMRAKRGKG
ncbi:hypothetical protein RR42_s2372 [Cupriavidus basilensis]|uniref:Uncharacterized protein n=1 Tax=Cupriavidus basilensis TaxID=68895 RepID=A0A0C4YPI2_9BURK|nr:hypothetical protein RR42_s2372 [Cupriavidus basilensis]